MVLMFLYGRIDLQVIPIDEVQDQEQNILKMMMMMILVMMDSMRIYR
jgi:hypothetical protein